MVEIKPSEITPEHVYLSRRKFMVGIGSVVAGSVLLSACGGETPLASLEPTASLSKTSADSGKAPTQPAVSTATAEPAMTDELGDAATSFPAVIGYNNYYEFTVDKQAVQDVARDFVTSPWSVAVGGLVQNPKTYDIDELLKFDQEERIYRMRCVEGWSMVIPWVGFPLSTLLKAVEPLPEAKYVRFETLYDPDRMPGQNAGYYEWPYTEGLRVDEAMNDLTILSTGLYGKELLPQNGAPVRLVVPWKYGFKSIKSIVKIDLVEVMPTSLWMAAAPHEYGFYANVNPEVDHPRWSQATERRIGETGRRSTLMFNGYEDKVAHLYEGMDLRKWY